MSLPPPVTSGPTNPNYDYGYDPYSTTSLRQNYGSGEMGGSEAPENQAYAQQLIQYHQMYMALLQQMPANDPRRDTIMQYEAMIREFYQEATGQPWDPNAFGGNGMNGGYGTPGMDPNNPMGTQGNGMDPNAPQYGEMIWQDQSRVKWDGTDPVVYTASQQGDTRQQDFFQSDVTIQIPYHGAKAKAELVDDDSVSGAKMLKVTISMSDGSTRVVCVHNVTDKSNIHLQSADPSNIAIDASVTSSSVASQIVAEEITDATTTDAMGDQPVKRKDGKMGYDGTSFEIYPPGDGKDYSVSARNDVHMHAASNTEFWTVEWDDSAKQYVVKVYSDEAHTKVLNTYHIDDMTNLKLSFDIDPTHIEFLGVLKGTDAHTLSTSNDHAKKLSFDTTASGSAPTDAPQGIQDLATATGKTTDEVSKLILQYYPSVDKDNDGKLTEEELNSAKAAGTFPPVIPDGNFMHFLYDLDGQLKTLTDQLASGDANKRDMIIGPLRDRLVTVLGKFYDSVSPVTSSADPVNACDDIKIGSTSYDFLGGALNGDQGKYKWNNTPYGGNPWELFDITPGNTQ